MGIDDKGGFAVVTVFLGDTVTVDLYGHFILSLQEEKVPVLSLKTECLEVQCLQG